jgi:penicillin-binding protein 2
LIVLVVLGAVVLIARLFAVQVLEGKIWTAQADTLTREGSVEPYTRGEILDCNGRVLARDVESYRIEADYRDFRRGNALGIVAHARSALEMRAVPLSAACERLSEWAVALAGLSPADLDSFQRGGALACNGLKVSQTESPAEESRPGRALDLAFYATALFDLQSSERSKLKKLGDAQRKRAFVELIADMRGLSRNELERTLAARCSNDMGFLQDFARLSAADNQVGGAAPLAHVLDELEHWRGEVEDGAASDLFDAAAGFPAGRIDAGVLYEFFDLDWIRRCLRWDESRLCAWTRTARADWLSLRDGQMLDFAVERLRRDGSSQEPADLVMREVTPQFTSGTRASGGVHAAESDWSDCGPPIVIEQLSTLFDVDLPKGANAPPRLPMFDHDFVQAVAAAANDAGVLARAEFWCSDGATVDPVLLESAAASWRARFAGRLDREELRTGFEALLLRLEDAFQTELHARFRAMKDRAREDERLNAAGKMPMAKARLDRAEERVRYILKDRGSRHFVAVARPSYALVNLLTRYPQYLRGFEVEKVHLRVNPTRDAEDRPIARLLVGRLAPPSVSRRLSQGEIEREIALLMARGGRDEGSESTLAELRAELDRPDEEVGAFGLERWFEHELAGSNGFRESRGLAERESGARGRSVLDKVDGLPLTMTLSADLQAEAEYCLEHPDADGSSSAATDEYWRAHPTGAIVLLSPKGDVIVAASAPLVARPTEPGHSIIGDQVRERTLTKPDFQPPGSTFKIFVAAYGLDRLGLDPRETRECSPAANHGGNGPGYGGVHCHDTTSAGHLSVDLRRALTVSCNSYFAWVGEKYDTASLAEMANEFGFGEPTGVLALASPSRSGLHEDCVPKLFKGKPVTGRQLCEAANGLSVVEATPMQLARATAALATGKLPTLRLVSRIGTEEQPQVARALTLSEASLDIVRSAMVAVTQDSEGSAHQALSQSDLGYLMAAKTGSADVSSKAVEENRVLKHTWVAGWFPAENPVGVLVVFEYHTTRTSNHGAIWLARQFLTRPAVRTWIAEQMASR